MFPIIMVSIFCCRLQSLADGSKGVAGGGLFVVEMGATKGFCGFAETVWVIFVKRYMHKMWESFIIHVYVNVNVYRQKRKEWLVLVLYNVRYDVDR